MALNFDEFYHKYKQDEDDATTKADELKRAKIELEQARLELQRQKIELQREQMRTRVEQTTRQERANAVAYGITFGLSFLSLLGSLLFIFWAL